MSSKNKLLSNIDDALHIITGKRLIDMGFRVVEYFGEDLVRKLFKEEQAQDPNDPYAILEIRPGAHSIIVKAAYRALARQYHPDSDLAPNREKFQKIQEAYDEIMSKQKEESNDD